MSQPAPSARLAGAFGAVGQRLRRSQPKSMSDAHPLLHATIHTRPVTWYLRVRFLGSVQVERVSSPACVFVAGRFQKKENSIHHQIGARASKKEPLATVASLLTIAGFRQITRTFATASCRTISRTSRSNESSKQAAPPPSVSQSARSLTFFLRSGPSIHPLRFAQQLFSGRRQSRRRINERINLILTLCGQSGPPSQPAAQPAGSGRAASARSKPGAFRRGRRTETLEWLTFAERL